MGAVYGDHAAVGVALPVFLAVNALPGVSLLLVVPGVVGILCVVPAGYGSRTRPQELRWFVVVSSA